MNTIILYDKKITKNTDTNILLFDLKYFIIFYLLSTLARIEEV